MNHAMDFLLYRLQWILGTTQVIHDFLFIAVSRSLYYEKVPQSFVLFVLSHGTHASFLVGCENSDAIWPRVVTCDLWHTLNDLVPQSSILFLSNHDLRNFSS
mgnify:FL=1